MLFKRVRASKTSLSGAYFPTTRASQCGDFNIMQVIDLSLYCDGSAHSHGDTDGYSYAMIQVTAAAIASVHNTP